MENPYTKVITRIQIQKPASEVYEAIVNPDHMTLYFISESTGRLEEGSSPEWKFSEFDMRFSVNGKRMEKDRYISFTWEMNGVDHLVEIILEHLGDNDTKITITEGREDGENADIHFLKGNTEGWANFLACLKAYVEYGINLRKGAFEFMKEG